MIEEVDSIMNGFDPISLKEMDSVALLKRTDTKFVVPANMIIQMLAGLEDSYRVLTIDDNHVMTYVSEYYDTQNFKFYKDHHNGKLNRTKVRIRKYVESGIYFLEVKRKNGKGITRKNRIRVDSFQNNLSENSVKFISDTTSKDYELFPSLTNSFKRVTLVNLKEKERVTIDLALSFTKGENLTKMEELAVVELKQERFNRNSAIVRKLRALGYHRFSMSKYCIGMAGTTPDLKHNAFKPKFLKFKKLIAA